MVRIVMKTVMRRLLAPFIATFALLACTSSTAPSAAADDAVDADDGAAEQELKKCGAPSGPASKRDADRLWSQVPEGWQALLETERAADYFPRLASFVATARRTSAATTAAPVYPADEDTFTALALTDPKDVRVVILGQDPYFNPGEAHGLAFSVKPPTRPPPSLHNIFKELQSDIPETKPVSHGDLAAWAKQGVLLLNTILTVEDGRPGSHACQGWEMFSDAIITKLSESRRDLVFVLWGEFAQSKTPLINPRHIIIKGAHPSPLSAKKFLGTRPFTQINAALASQHKRQVNWQLPETP